LLVVLVEECSLDSPLGESLVEFDDECSVVVSGATGAGATTTAGGATTIGAGYIATGAGAEVVVSLVRFEVVVSV
jgi:hypothetical protein